MKIRDRGLLLVAACGLVQSVAWFVLALLGILIYKCAIELPDQPDPAALFGTRLAKFYIADDACAMYNRSRTMWLTPPEGVLIINSIIISYSCLWVISSILLIWEGVRVMEQRRHWVLWCWVAITAFVCLSDLGVFINFCVDYSNTVRNMRAMQSYAFLDLALEDELTWLGTPVPGLELLSFSAFMMSMAARGYTLWILNAAAALWVGFQALGGGCRGDDQDERTSLKHHFLTSLYSERQDKPDGLSAPWAVQSPVVGTAPRPPPWTANDAVPAIEIPRPFRLGPPPPGRPPRTSAIPEPDYDRDSLLSREPPQTRESPQAWNPPKSRESPHVAQRSALHAKDALRRQPPPLDEMPRRSALKKVNSPQTRFAGKTVF